MKFDDSQSHANPFCRVESYELRLHSGLPKHFHDHYAVGLIESGETVLGLGEQEIFLSSGDVILLNPGEKHSCAPLAGEDLKFTGLNIASHFLEMIFHEHVRDDCRPLFIEKRVSDPRLAACVLGLHGRLCGRRRESCISRSTKNLFHRLFESCKVEAGSGNSREKNTINYLCRYMNDRYFDPVRLDDLCRLSGLSKSTLTRSFEREMNMTPYGYLTSVRIRHAKRFLASGLSVGDVAMKTGFADQSHFTNRFRSQTGMTPGEYRKIFYVSGGTRLV